MSRKILIAGVVLLALIIAGGGFAVWQMMNQPLYKPGMVSAGKNLRAPLAPPTQSGEADFWNVEADVKLFHFSAGEGRNVLVIHGGPGATLMTKVCGSDMSRPPHCGSVPP